MDVLTWSKSSWREDEKREARSTLLLPAVLLQRRAGATRLQLHISLVAYSLCCYYSTVSFALAASRTGHPPLTSAFPFPSLGDLYPPVLQWVTSNTQHQSSALSSSPSSSFGVSLSPAWSTISLPPSRPVYAITLPCPLSKTPWRMASPLPPSTCPTI